MAGISSMTSDNIQAPGATLLIESYEEIARIFEKCANSTHIVLNEIIEFKDCQLNCLNQSKELLSSSSSFFSLKIILFLIASIIAVILIVGTYILHRYSKYKRA